MKNLRFIVVLIVVLLLQSCGGMRNGNFYKRKYLDLKSVDIKSEANVAEEEDVYAPIFSGSIDGVKDKAHQFEIIDSYEVSNQTEVFPDENLIVNDIEIEPEDSTIRTDPDETWVNQYESNTMKYTRRAQGTLAAFGVWAVIFIVFLLLATLGSIYQTIAMLLVGLGLGLLGLGFVFAIGALVNASRWKKATHNRQKSEEDKERYRKWSKMAKLMFFAQLGAFALPIVVLLFAGIFFLLF